MLKADIGQSSPRLIELWGGTTDPRSHRPDNFRYLVHMDTGIRSTTHRGEVAIAHDPSLEGRRYIDDLTQIHNTSSLSASLIDSQRRTPYFSGRLGLILDVPVRSIMAASSHDIHSHSHECLPQAFFDKRKHTPEAILNATDTYNEVLLRPDGISVTGLLYLGDNWKREETPTYESAATYAERLRLPLVVIEPGTN